MSIVLRVFFTRTCNLIDTVFILKPIISVVVRHPISSPSLSVLHTNSFSPITALTKVMLQWFGNVICITVG